MKDLQRNLVTTIVGVTKSTTENERFATKSGDDLKNFDPSSPSTTTTSVTNQYETPTASTFDNNSVQREDEEIAHFHKLTQQVTTSYLGDQTDASTVQDKTANSDPTDASIEDINNGNQFGQTTIVDVTKSTTEDERFETKSGDDLENFDPSSPSTTTTSEDERYKPE
ncbi:hypothetical protein QE152_g6823 [Popillia japonica]|uniref:Uncharacterized protein n=1 Tax=Popillia japonica TaxID=7064 RepID=A0AAW1MH84_POPJA